MKELPQVDDFHNLFLSDTPMLDVRAPVEFLQGAFPNTTNKPLINNEERQQIGLRYKEQGQQKAIDLGYWLVSGDIREERIAKWLQFVKQNPQGVLYCFRGGLRSRITQQWIYEQSGVIYPRVKGGYKAMRRYLIEEMNRSCMEMQPIILSGRTGIGKTLLLQNIQNKIDLEKIYHHRGSVFGKHADPQPSQIDIENILSIDLLKLRQKDRLYYVTEDESCMIGSRRIPENLFEKMKQSPVVILEVNIDERVETTFQEYITDSLLEYQNMYGDEQLGFTAWAENLQHSLNKIQRRLGGLRHSKLKQIMADALEKQITSGDLEDHKLWIKSLLVDYYDPMYDYQLSRKKHRVVFKGNKNEVLDFLSRKYQIDSQISLKNSLDRSLRIP